MTVTGRLAAAAASGALVISLAGCSVSINSKPSEGNTDTPSGTSSLIHGKDTRFVSSVRESYPYFDNIPDKTMIGIAKNACTALDNGANGSDLVDKILSITTAPDEVRAYSYLTGYGVRTYCPRNVDNLSDGLDN